MKTSILKYGLILLCLGFAQSTFALDQCNSTSQCRVAFGPTASDCQNSRSTESICMCGGDRCDVVIPQNNAVSVPALVEAEEFDRFEDSSDSHFGDCNEGPVDQQQTTDVGGGCNVGWTTAGEWLEYDIHVAERDNYDFALRLASAREGQTVNVAVDGDSIGFLRTPDRGWQAWRTRRIEDVDLRPGNHIVRVTFSTGATNFNNFEIAKSQGADEPAPEPTPEPAPEPDVASDKRPGDQGVTFDRSKFDPDYPQMREWVTAGVRGGIPPIDSLDIKRRISAGNSADINRAINQVANDGGGAVLLRDGKYIINNQVVMQSNVVLIGESRDGVVAEIHMNNGNGFFFGSGVSRSGISRMTIQGRWGTPEQDWNINDRAANNELPGNENVSVMFRRSTDSWIDGVNIYNSADFPIRVSANHITMRDLDVDGVHNKHGGAHGYFFILGGYNLLTQSRMTHLRHLSLQGDNVEYNVVYDNDLRQEVSFHSGDNGNNLIENNRITLPRSMPNNRPDYRGIMGSWSSRHRNSANPNFIWNNTVVQLNHGGTTPLSGDERIYTGPLVANTRGQRAEDNWRPSANIPRDGTLYPIVLD